LACADTDTFEVNTFDITVDRVLLVGGLASEACLKVNALTIYGNIFPFFALYNEVTAMLS
jgi:hypothetical protein